MSVIAMIQPLKNTRSFRPCGGGAQWALVEATVRVLFPLLEMKRSPDRPRILFDTVLDEPQIQIETGWVPESSPADSDKTSHRA